MTFIKTEQDAAGDEFDIHHQDSLILCPAMSLFLKTYAEVLDSGFANPSITWKNSNRMVWAERDQQVIAGICYEYMPEIKLGWIVLIFTDKKFRGRRLKEKLHDVFEKDIQGLGGKRLGSFVHMNNVSSLKSAERVGLLPDFYRMYKKI